MSDNPGTQLAGGLQNQSRRYLWAAGAIGVVFLLASLSRRNQSNAPQTGGSSGDARTVYVPTQSETTIINYQSGNTSTVNNGGSSTPNKNTGADRVHILPWAGPLEGKRRPITDAIRPKPVGDTTDVQRPRAETAKPKADRSGSFINSFALAGRSSEPRLVSQSAGATSEATVRVVYAEFFGDQPSADTIAMWERHYQQNNYSSIGAFEQYLRKWAAAQ